jgi:hypothetical protein
MSEVEFKVVIKNYHPLPQQVPVALKKSKYPFAKMKELDMFVFDGSLAQANCAAVNATKAYADKRNFEARTYVDPETNDVKVGIWRTLNY